MILKDNYGVDFNPEKKWAIIYSYIPKNGEFHLYYSRFFILKKYKSLDSALEAFRCKEVYNDRILKVAEIAYGFNGRPYIVGLEHPPIDHSYGPQKVHPLDTEEYKNYLVSLDNIKKVY
jgi:hypothetical protein